MKNMNIEPLSSEELKTIEGGNGAGMDPTGAPPSPSDNGAGIDPNG